MHFLSTFQTTFAPLRPHSQAEGGHGSASCGFVTAPFLLELLRRNNLRHNDNYYDTVGVVEAKLQCQIVSFPKVNDFLEVFKMNSNFRCIKG